MRAFATAIVAAMLVFGGGANAAVTTFPTSVFQAGGTGSANLVGNTAGTARLNRGQTIGLNYSAPISVVAGSRLFFNFTQVSNNTTYVWVRLGNWNGTTFTSAAASGQSAPNGTPTANIYAQVAGSGVVTIFTDPFLASCQLIGGCNALAFGNSTFSAGGSFFRISSLIAATPEPTAWAMMMMGFAGVAFRLKAMRKKRRNAAASTVRAAA